MKTIEREMRAIVLQAMGFASLCWEPKPTGVFCGGNVTKEGDTTTAKLMTLVDEYCMSRDELILKVATLSAEVARYREALEKLAKLGNGDKYGNSVGNIIAQTALNKKG